MTRLRHHGKKWSWPIFAAAALLCSAEMYLAVHAARSETAFFDELEFEEETAADAATIPADWITAKYGDLSRWVRPAVPLKVALQVGHWKNSELPDELEKLRGTSTGARAVGIEEWEMAMVIAEKTKRLLEEKFISVDILPATIPPAYWADAIISIHADGNVNTSVSGYKMATPRRDLSGRGAELLNHLMSEYGKATGLKTDDNITRNMRGYYAFNWRRYQHAIHPMTPAVILETGFLTSPRDRQILIKNPDKAAQGIANAVFIFLGFANDLAVE